MPVSDTNDPSASASPDDLALHALVWILGDPDRAHRLLDLTGLDPAGLRASAGDPAVLAATLSFLESNERDLLACANDLNVRPESLVAARERLEA
ncbi:MAG TPA: DUF3572 domain-containing protein [Sphingomonas sp.]|jgi:hypothetical protein